MASVILLEDEGNLLQEDGSALLLETLDSSTSTTGSRVLLTLTNAISKLNTLYNGSSTPPVAGEEDYIVWTDLFNIAINLWEDEEGILWKELFVKSADAPDGDIVTVEGDSSYALPSLFKFPASGYVWLGSGTSKTAFKVVRQEDVTLWENDTSKWCYFTNDLSSTLEFNPNCSILGNEPIVYSYYKYAQPLTTGTDSFEMSDPMFAVYYALSELKKEEGDTSALTIATQKMEAMRTRAIMPAWNQEMSLKPKRGGFAI